MRRGHAPQRAGPFPPPLPPPPCLLLPYRLPPTTRPAQPAPPCPLPYPYDPHLPLPPTPPRQKNLVCLVLMTQIRVQLTKKLKVTLGFSASASLPRVPCPLFPYPQALSVTPCPLSPCLFSPSPPLPSTPSCPDAHPLSKAPSPMNE